MPNNHDHVQHIQQDYIFLNFYFLFIQLRTVRLKIHRYIVINMIIEQRRNYSGMFRVLTDTRNKIQQAAKERL